MKTHITLKSIGTLAPNEVDQITKLIDVHIPNAGKSYIDSKTITGPDFDIALLKDESGEIMAATYYHLMTIQTPFSPTPLPIVQFGLALKSHQYKANATRKLGTWYFKNKVGMLYPLKSLVSLSYISNPRVMEKMMETFPRMYPFKGEYTSELANCLNTYLNTSRQIKADLNTSQTAIFDLPEKTDITADWEKLYKAKNSRINNFFAQNGVLIFEGNKVYRTNKVIICCGLRMPMNMKVGALKALKVSKSKMRQLVTN